MFRKRIRTKKPESRPKPKASSSPYWNDLTVRNIWPHFISFFATRDAIALFKVNRSSSGLGRASVTWATLLTQHYGKTAFGMDYLQQYKCHFFFEDALANADQARFFNKLKPFIVENAAPWALYFKAQIVRHSSSPLLTRTFADYALTALEAGDTYAYSPLLDYFKYPFNHARFNASHLTFFLTLTHSEEMEPQRIADRCVVGSLLGKHTSYMGNREMLTEQQLDCFFNLYPSLTKKQLICTVVDLFMALRVIPIEKKNSLLAALNTADIIDNLDIIMHPELYEFIRADRLSHTKLVAWFKHMSEGSATACYHYAKQVMESNVTFGKNYLQKAIEGLEFRALEALHTHFSRNPDIMTEPEYDALVRFSAERDCMFAINLILQKKNWHKELDYVWALLTSALGSKDPCSMKEKFIALTMQIEKTSLLVRCAATLIHLSKANNYLAREQYEIARSGNAFIFLTFLAHGKKSGLLKPEHEKAISLLEATEEKPKIARQSARLMKH